MLMRFEAKKKTHTQATVQRTVMLTEAAHR